jgi:hypothetical protein
MINRLKTWLQTIKGSQASSIEQRKYFEVWGEALESVQFLKKLSLGLVLSNAMLLILADRVLRKPPLVIRVSEVGRAEAIHDVEMLAQVTKPEVLNFVNLFLKYYLERNVYTWKDNLVLAGQMMTPEFRAKMGRDAGFDQETMLLETQKLTSKLQISNVSVTRVTSDHILVSVRGWRQVTSYTDPKFLKETVFEVDLSLRKVPRSMKSPYGLLVDAYKQTDFRDD